MKKAIVTPNTSAYIALHAWIVRRKGKASSCEECGKNNGKIEWSNISGEYLKDVNDYRALCSSCHKKQDYKRKYGNACMKGHQFTQENTRLESRLDGIRRICRRCTALRQRAWRQRNA